MTSSKEGISVKESNFTRTPPSRLLTRDDPFTHKYYHDYPPQPQAMIKQQVAP